MSKKGRSGRGWLVTGTAKATGGRCVACHRAIVYGDRCPPCAQQLRQRQRRKPR